VFDSAEHAASLFNLQTFRQCLQPHQQSDRGGAGERGRALEGGRAALACASAWPRR